MDSSESTQRSMGRINRGLGHCAIQSSFVHEWAPSEHVLCEGTAAAVGESRLSLACVQMEGDILSIGKYRASQSRPCVSVVHTHVWYTHMCTMWYTHSSLVGRGGSDNF